MEAKFTKGAWKKVRNIEDNKIRGIDGPQNECIIRWGGIARPESEEGQANATLMIASPLLYEALKECRKELEEFKRLAHGKQDFPPTKGMEMADNALSKARGEK